MADEQVHAEMFVIKVGDRTAEEGDPDEEESREFLRPAHLVAENFAGENSQQHIDHKDQ